MVSMTMVPALSSMLCRQRQFGDRGSVICHGAEQIGRRAALGFDLPEQTLAVAVAAASCSILASSAGLSLARVAYHVLAGADRRVRCARPDISTSSRNDSRNSDIDAAISFSEGIASGRRWQTRFIPICKPRNAAKPLIARGQIVGGGIAPFQARGCAARRSREQSVGVDFG